MPEPPNLDPPDTPEGRLDKLEARLARLDTTDEKVAALEARLGRLDETDEKVGQLERRLEKLDQRPPPVEAPPHPTVLRPPPLPPPAPAADAAPVWFYPPDLTKRGKRRRG